MREGAINHNKIGPAARVLRCCQAAPFEEIPDEPWEVRLERVISFTTQGEQQCIEELKKKLEEDEIDQEELEIGIDWVKHQWVATFNQMTAMDESAATFNQMMEKDEDTAMPEFPVPKGKPQVAQPPQWPLSDGASSGGTGGTAPVPGAASAPLQVPFHRCSVALSAEQAAQVEATKIVRCAWFGNGQSVPVKNCVASTVEAFCDAPTNTSLDLPSQCLLFMLPQPLFDEWIHKGKMKAVPRLDGYRIHGDLNLALVDPFFKLLPLRAPPTR